MRKLLMSMAITFIAIDLLFNMILPAMLVSSVLVKKSSANFQSDMQAWRISMQLLEDIRVQFVLAFNIQMVYFYYKLSLPNSEGVPMIIEPIEPSQPLIESTELETIIDDNPFTRASRTVETNSFARLLENENSLYIKDRENEIFNQHDLTENQRFLAQAAERMSLRSSYK